MILVETAQTLLLSAGCLFFMAGSIALIRFPDTYTRLHALSKADNVGFGLVVLALLPSAGSLLASAKLVLIWLIVLGSSATIAYLIAGAAQARRVQPWTRPERDADDHQHQPETPR